MYWGYAAVNYVDVYNVLPHSALDNKSPWECEKGRQPDLTWFKPFGCRATVYIGQHTEQLSHHKLAPRGEPTIYLGLGYTRGRKGWCCWNPENKRLYCTRDVVFDETFFPARAKEINAFLDTTTRRLVSGWLRKCMAPWSMPTTTARRLTNFRRPSSLRS